MLPTVFADGGEVLFNGLANTYLVGQSQILIVYEENWKNSRFLIHLTKKPPLRYSEGTMFRHSIKEV